MNAFAKTLLKYGADIEALKLFESEGPDLLPYATLVSAKKGGDEDLSSLGGVYEWQDAPLIFLIDNEILQDDQERLHRIRRRIAMRGDAPYLGVVSPGRLTVYRVSLDAERPENARVPLDVPRGDERITLAYLGNKRPGAATDRRKWISNVILKLLSQSISKLKAPQIGTSDADAISLVGRAVFTRFLGDRKLLPKSLTNGDADTLFDDAQKAKETSEWLDQTFNGDFLPLSDGLFGNLPDEAFIVLGCILRRAPGGQLYLGWKEKWENLDFSQIPVGVLSQAYELYLRENAPEKQRKEGGYYTPRTIADLMVRGAFHALRSQSKAHTATVLDPAAGAGVFLLIAFRQIVAEVWRNDKKKRQPDTEKLRKILYSQITGFDINESALRFAALGLYLMSIELDPHPEPVQKLKFENLRGIVLHKVGEGGNDVPSRCLGSLGNQIGSEHIEKYDLVIGNPPWASGTQLPDWAVVRSIVSDIANKRSPKNSTPPPLPNEVLDLPFIWRAMDWAKKGAQIAFALHARILFQQGEGMPDARRALFSALDITGIVNGSELRQTMVWPEIDAPFCLVFARNQVPAPGAGFRFVTPKLEDELNGIGGLRVDATNAEIVTSEQVCQRPEILKILFRGNQLDLEIYDRLKSKGFHSLDEFWRDYFGVHRGRAAGTGNGYQRLRASSRIRKDGDGLPGVSADYLHGMPEISSASMNSIRIRTSELNDFNLPRIHDPRPSTLFEAPLLLVHQSPPAHGGRIRVAICEENVVFNETYYGYSASHHDQGVRLVKFLALLIGSKPALWYTLITSGKFGFERDVVEKITIDQIPIPSFSEFNESQFEEIDSLFEEVAENNTELTWKKVDDWAAGLFGLRKRDLEVIEDTLAFNLPFSDNKKKAQLPPKPKAVEEFCTTLDYELRPWLENSNISLEVSSGTISAYCPWNGVWVCLNSPAETKKLYCDFMDLLGCADQLAATEVIFPNVLPGCLWLGRLNQARYWSKSQARLVARNIAWEHLDLLTGGKQT